jgi:hypothetical protein
MVPIKKYQHRSAKAGERHHGLGLMLWADGFISLFKDGCFESREVAGEN